MNKQELFSRLCIVDDQYPNVTEELAEQTKASLCAQHCVNLDDYGVSIRKVLAGKVAHVDILKLDSSGNLRGDQRLGKVTLNFELYMAWENSEIQCFRIGFTHGKDILTTLSRSEYLAELHKIEKELLIKHGYNFRSYLFDVRLDDRDWKHFSNLVKFIMVEEFGEIFK